MTNGPNNAQDTQPVKVKWACPECAAPANACGRGECRGRRAGGCCGFLCDCDFDTGDDHGFSFADRCPTATCDHCGWNGTFPVEPRGLQAWEKKALDAGWSPPAKRQKELGL